jgi:hypothetical protein
MDLRRYVFAYEAGAQGEIDQDKKSRVQPIRTQAISDMSRRVGLPNLQRNQKAIM